MYPPWAPNSACFVSRVGFVRHVQAAADQLSCWPGQPSLGPVGCVALYQYSVGIGLLSLPPPFKLSFSSVSFEYASKPSFLSCPRTRTQLFMTGTTWPFVGHFQPGIQLHVHSLLSSIVPTHWLFFKWSFSLTPFPVLSAAFSVESLTTPGWASLIRKT